MSGGHFQYDQYKIQYIADSIKTLIDNNDSQELTDWGDKIGRGYPPEVIAEFEKAIHALNVARVYAHRVDWLVSGDDGEESFLRRLESDLKEIEK